MKHGCMIAILFLSLAASALTSNIPQNSSEVKISFDDKTITLEYPGSPRPIDKIQVAYEKMSPEALKKFPLKLNESYEDLRKTSVDPKNNFLKEMAKTVEGVKVLSCDTGFEIFTGAHGGNVISSARCKIDRNGHQEIVKICGSSMTKDNPPAPLDPKAPLKETLLKHSPSCMGG